MPDTVVDSVAWCYKLKMTSPLILGITAIVCSRAMFSFFDDPEGPNLLIVAVTAAIVYSLSLGMARLFNPSAAGLKKLLTVILVQVIIVTAFYFCLK